MQKARTQLQSKYVADLRQLTGYFLGYVPDNYADQATEDGAWSLIENDPAVEHAIKLLAVKVAGETCEVASTNYLYKWLAESALSMVEDFIHCRFSLAKKGILYGLGVQEKIYKQVKFKEFPGMEWQVATEIIEIDRRRMRLERREDDRSETYWTIWHKKYNEYVVIEDMAEVPDYDGPLLQDFIWYVHEYEETNPYFRGLGEIIYPLAYIKKMTLQYWSDLCESWAKPFAVWYLDTAKAAIDAAGMGLGHNTVDRYIAKCHEVMREARARHSLVIDKKMEVKFHEAGSVGQNLLKEIIEYCDKKISLALIGIDLSASGGSSGGSYASDEIYRGDLQSIVQYNRVRQDEVLQRDLVMDFFFRNQKNLAALGLAMPSLRDIKLNITLSKFYRTKEESYNQKRD